MRLPSRFLSALRALAAGIALAALPALTGCAGAAVELPDLSADPGAFRSWFEGQAPHARAVLLLSPV